MLMKKIELIKCLLSRDEIDSLALFLHSFNARPKDGYWFSEKIMTKNEMQKYETAVLSLFESVTKNDRNENN